MTALQAAISPLVNKIEIAEEPSIEGELVLRITVEPATTFYVDALEGTAHNVLSKQGVQYNLSRPVHSANRATWLCTIFP